MKWGYKRAFLRCALLFAVGVAFQLIFGNIRPDWIRYPLGLILFINYIYALILLSAKSERLTWVRQLSDHYACISSLAGMLVMTLLFGLTGQNGSTEGFWGALGFRSMSTSWPFCIMLLYFITVLGMRAIDEIRNWRKRPALATVIHSAVFIVLSAALFGSGDMVRARIIFREGEQQHVGISPLTGRTTVLPFMISLDEFIMEEYPPEEIRLPSGKTITMQKGEPKMFLSKITVSDRKGERHFDVKVNHPAQVGIWKIYQVGYDKEMGTSTLECVRDSWYPVVKTGLWIILAAGIFMALTAGNRRKREDRQ